MANETNVKAGAPRNPSIAGRVGVFFKKSGDTKFKEFGNIIDPAISAEIERLAHYSTRRGIRAKDREEISGRSARLSFTIDEINKSNLQFVFGSKDAAATDSVDVKEGRIWTNPGSGQTITLGDTAIKNVVVTSVSEEGSETTYVVTTDYTVNLTTGVLTIAANPGALYDASAVPEIHVAYEKACTSKSFAAFTGDEIKGEMYFQNLTPGGPKWVVVATNCTVKNNGDIQIGDGASWTQMGITVEMLEDPQTGKLFKVHVLDAGQL